MTYTQNIRCVCVVVENRRMMIGPCRCIRGERSAVMTQSWPHMAGGGGNKICVLYTVLRLALWLFTLNYDYFGGYRFRFVLYTAFDTVVSCLPLFVVNVARV